MRWGQAKIILIIVILLVDLFLLFSFLQSSRSEQRIEALAQQESLDLLEKAGITLDPGIIDRKTDMLRTYESQRDTEKEIQAAEALLGPGTSGRNTEEGPENEGSVTYRSTAGTLMFMQNGIMVGQVAYSGTEADEATIERFFPAEIMGAYTVIREGRNIRLIKLIDGYPVDNESVTVTPSGQNLVISGRWNFGQLMNAGEQPKQLSELFLDLRNELIREKAGIITIDGITTEYTAYQATGGTRYQPVWHLKAGNKDYYYDIVRGLLVTR